jgi:T5orf172 domain
MNETENKINGYVYVLEVKDIMLPVCKIGKTSRHPNERCAEINRSSTGDFIWEVAHYVFVDDYNKLESLVHEKLRPLKQKNREFFNLNANDGFIALRSILASQSIIKEIFEEAIIAPNVSSRGAAKNKKPKINFKEIDSTYTDILSQFTSLIGVKGRPFGQLNNPWFGMSDGNEGVQWNIVIHRETNEVILGVNLEGSKYSGRWPITTFILSELKNPKINDVKNKLANSELIFVRFTRDAWQGPARLKIVEENLIKKDISISEISSDIWETTLKEALSCLNDKKQYRGRNRQMVTLMNHPENGKREKWVCPHLGIKTPININADLAIELQAGINRLKPIYNWVADVSQT